mgnify:CR=1 FL=1
MFLVMIKSCCSAFFMFREVFVENSFFPFIVLPLAKLMFSFTYFELGKDYPYPVVDLESNVKRGRTMIWEHRNNTFTQHEGIRIIKKHVRKK